MSDMRIVVSTQVYENYDHTGKSPCWKAKGGNDYVVGHVTFREAVELCYDEGGLQGYVDSLIEKYKDKIVKRDSFLDEFVRDWELVDGPTFDEQQAMEMSGEVMYPAFDLTADNPRVCSLKIKQ